MAQVTKAQLQAEVEALRHNAQMLEAERDALRFRAEAAEVQLATLKLSYDAMLVGQRPSHGGSPTRSAATPAVRRVFEFDPEIKGDFERASKLAAATVRGCVRRVQR